MRLLQLWEVLTRPAAPAGLHISKVKKENVKSWFSEAKRSCLGWHRVPPAHDKLP